MLNKIKNQKPLIHCITNPISINPCANAVLALGAKPVMAENPNEVSEITETTSNVAIQPLVEYCQTMKMSYSYKPVLILSILNSKEYSISINEAVKFFREFYETRKDGVNLYRTFSNEGVKIQKFGTEEIYDEAIDIENAPYIYVETEEKIENLEKNA